MLVSKLETNMDPIRTLHPLARAWLLDGPLSAHLDAYLTPLERGRYAEGSIEKRLRALAHFAHWMTRCRLAAVRQCRSVRQGVGRCGCIGPTSARRVRTRKGIVLGTLTVGKPRGWLIRDMRH